MEDQAQPGPEAAEQPKAETTSHEAERQRIIAALAYIPFLCFLAILMRDKDTTGFLLFHARQGVVITLLSVVMAVLGPILTIFVPFIGAVIAMCLNTGLALLILVGAWKAFQGEQWELPYLGDYAKNLKL